MSIEIPVLRLGLAGFSVQQMAAMKGLLQQCAPGRHAWHIGAFADADAWWLNGSRIQRVSEGTIRVLPAIPSERSLQLTLADVDRPVGISVPLAFSPSAPHYAFDPTSLPATDDVLEKFEAWLQPVAAQFSLAGRIIEQERVLGGGVYHVVLNERLLAVVDMHGETGVLPTAGPADFDDAIWVPQTGKGAIPPSFARASLSELMWQYALRTTRDLLPKRYSTGLLYFRRPPHVPQRLLSDSHLLLIRELATAAGTFADLQQRTGMVAPRLAKVLAALYLVGAITANPKRAAVSRTSGSRDEAQASRGLQHSIVPSGLEGDSAADTQPPPPYAPADFTVPMPLRPR